MLPRLFGDFYRFGCCYRSVVSFLYADIYAKVWWGRGGVYVCLNLGVSSALEVPYLVYFFWFVAT